MIVVLDQHSLIPSNDRIALYGDGCFTTIAISESIPELLELHLIRLKRDCRRLHINFQLWLDLENAVTKLALAKVSGVIKVVISRGQGGRGYSPKNCHNPTAYLSFSELPAHYANWRVKGISMAVSSVKLAIQPLLAGVKHLNRLEQVYIKRELDQIEFEDLLVCGMNGHVVESSAGNVFWRLNDKWFTPNLDECGVDGVMRNHLMDLFEKKNIVVEQRHSFVDELIECDELVVTNCLMKIIPVNRLETDNSTRTWQRDGSQVNSLLSELTTVKGV